MIQSRSLLSIHQGQKFNSTLELANLVDKWECKQTEIVYYHRSKCKDIVENLIFNPNKRHFCIQTKWQVNDFSALTRFINIYANLFRYEKYYCCFEWILRHGLNANHAKCRRATTTKKDTVNLNYLSAELNNPPSEIIPGYDPTIFSFVFPTERIISNLKHTKLFFPRKLHFTNNNGSNKNFSLYTICTWKEKWDFYNAYVFFAFLADFEVYFTWNQLTNRI